MCLSVHAAGQSRHDRHPHPGDGHAELIGLFLTVLRTAPRAHDGQRSIVLRRQRALHVETDRRVRDLVQQGGVVIVFAADHANAEILSAAEFLFHELLIVPFADRFAGRRPDVLDTFEFAPGRPQDRFHAGEVLDQIAKAQRPDALHQMQAQALDGLLGTHTRPIRIHLSVLQSRRSTAGAGASSRTLSGVRHLACRK